MRNIYLGIRLFHFSMAEEEYVPHRKRGADKNSVWFYFLINKNKGDSAKCKRCSAILQAKGGSTKGLMTHLLKIHKIDLKILRTNQEVADVDTLGLGSSTSSRSSSAAVPESTLNPKSRKITDFFVSKTDKSFEAVLARMTAVDGLSFRVFQTSVDLRDLLEAKGYNVPKSAHTIKSKVIDYSKKIRSICIEQMVHIKSKNGRFSLTFDEWTSTANKRYLNINVHSQKMLWNIGLVRIEKSMTSEVCVELLETRLKEHKLSLLNDIVGFTTDGASVMTKLRKLIPPAQQLCFAHGLQLAVVDTLYKKPVQSDKTNSEDRIINIGDNDAIDDLEDVFDDSGLVFCNEVLEVIELSSSFDIDATISKTRNIIRSFRKSPTKNDVLQKYIKEQHGREMQLILDCRTRWSSLCLMLERFVFLEDAIKKSMIDFKMEPILSSEFKLLDNLVKLLEPIKLTVNVLCQRDTNLCMADTALKFMLEEIAKVRSNLGGQFEAALRHRIKERRTVFSGLIRYLQNPHDRNTDQLFTIPDKDTMVNEMEKLMRRLTELADDTDPDIEEVSDEDDNIPLAEVAQQRTEISDNSTLRQKLQEAVLKSMKPPTPYPKKGSLTSAIRQEMTLYEGGGHKGRNLQMVYDFLLTISPTSVESERVFSAAGSFCTKIRSKLSDSALDELTFLRYYFKKSSESE